MPTTSSRRSTVQRLYRCLSTTSMRTHAAVSRIPRRGPKTSNILPSSIRSDEQAEYVSKLSKLLYQDSVTRRIIFRIIVLSPLIGMALIHSPFEIMRVNGPSMSPLFNPNYDTDSDLPNSHTDQILVQTRGLPDLFFDVNAARKAQRKADTDKPVKEEDNGVSKFKRGQIITFYTPHNPDRIAVKRIVGLPGDRVQPLAGYSGGEDAVIVPWNHLWVEGDADSRQKSIDSNWYGPISQNLVIGEVRAVLTPWWKPTWVDWKHHRWPAMEKERVEEAAVAEAASDPQVVTLLREWTDGTNQERLEAMREAPEAFRAYFASSEDVRKRVRQFYRNAALVLARDDPDSDRFELAQDIIGEMEKIYGTGALRQGMVKRSSRKVPQTSVDDNKTTALAAEHILNAQGWSVERDSSGRIKTQKSLV